MAFPRATAEVDYPLFAVDFDPEDATRILVGGGGGPGRSGVANKIVSFAPGRSVYDCSNAVPSAQTLLENKTPDELRIAGEVELSRDEDSVMSLAVGARKGKQSTVYAGVNSSAAQIAKGTNQHLRTMNVEPSKQKGKSGEANYSITEKARDALFKNPAEDTYQRLLRMSGRMGIAASAFGNDPQIALFDTSGSSISVRGVIELSRDVEDMDILQVSATGYLVVFCYKYELHLFRLDKDKDSSEPQLIFTMPIDEPQRPSFRSVRFLTENFILAAANLPNRSGVALHSFRLPNPAKGTTMAKLAASARVPRKISVTALAVGNLTPRASFDEPQGDSEFVVAVAGHDSSISLYTLQHHKLSAIFVVYDILPVHTFHQVHGVDNITGLSFSTFVSPPSKASSPSPSREQLVKLASISLQKTIAVHTIPLKKFVDESVPRNPKGPPRPFRFITATRAQKPKQARTVLSLMGFVVLIMSLIGRAVYEYLHTGSMPRLPNLLNPYGILKSAPTVSVTPEVLVARHDAADLQADFLAKVGVEKAPGYGETIVVVETKPTAAGEDGTKDIKVEVHDEEVHGPGKTWEELPEAQQQAWMKRLHDAGAWTQHMGESVFKGVLFGELAGAVGHVVGG